MSACRMCRKAGFRRALWSQVAGITVLLVGTAALAWWFRQEARRPLAEAWAAGTDRIG